MKKMKLSLKMVMRLLICKIQMKMMEVITMRAMVISKMKEMDLKMVRMKRRVKLSIILLLAIKWTVMIVTI